MISIAIDGYSGSGKGTLADGLAQRFNLAHLDSGAALRAMGLYFLNQNITDPTEKDIAENLDKISIRFKFSGKTQFTYLNGKDVSSLIRQEEVGQMASKIAVNPTAMLKIMKICRNFAKKHDCVIDGRNITSALLPNADVKIFLDADPKCRAQRRYEEMLSRNLNPNLDEIAASLSKRDYRDAHRDFAPLVKTEDTILIDNTNLNIEETIEVVSKIVEEKIAAKQAKGQLKS